MDCFVGGGGGGGGATNIFIDYVLAHEILVLVSHAQKHRFTFYPLYCVRVLHFGGNT